MPSKVAGGNGIKPVTRQKRSERRRENQNFSQQDSDNMKIWPQPCEWSLNPKKERGD